MSPPFGTDELSLIRECHLDQSRARLREEFRAIIADSSPEFRPFVSSSPSNSEADDFIYDVLSELARSKCAKSVAYGAQRSLREATRAFLANWPKIVTLHPSIIQPCATLLECVVSDASDDLAVWSALSRLVMSPPFSIDELSIIHESHLDRLRARLREDFRTITVDSPESSSFISSSPSNSEAADFVENILTDLARVKCAKSVAYRTQQSLRDAIYAFLANWPKIVTLHPPIIQPCATLLERVVSDVSDDLAVWFALYDLLAESNRPATPPAVVSVKTDTFDTPARSNSGARLTESQTHEHIDPYIRAEIRGTVYTDVLGFDNYFLGVDGSQWDCASRCIDGCSDTCQAQWSRTDDVAENIPPWPTNATEAAAVRWFRDFNGKLALPGPVGPTRFYSSGARVLTGSRCQRKCDIFLSQMLMDTTGAEAHPAVDHQYSWYDVLVPGELKSNKDDDCAPKTVLELAGYVREVFGAQVGRRFVHAFTICGDFMRCWLFDRAGVSISRGFHISKDRNTFKLFIRVMLCYVKMSAGQFGFDPNYMDRSGGVFLPSRQRPTPAELTFKGRRFRLLKTIFYQPAIVTRGTLCWLGEDCVTGEECVVKDAWRSKYRRPEGELLEDAREKGVWGTLDCRYHGDVFIADSQDEIASNVRRGLDYTEARGVRISQKTIDGMLCLTNSEMASDGTQRMSRPSSQKLAQRSSNTAKRRFPGLHTPRKRLKLLGPGSEGSQSENKRGDRDRVHSRLVFYTVGRDITQFESVGHLLEVFHDAIKCHQSLIEKAKILHRDISINNIMISKNPGEGDPKGFLIDLDLAENIDSQQRTGAPHRTGTMEFMAIEALEGNVSQSWRHDLESFFYVFIWICVLFDGTGKPRNPQPAELDGWSSKYASDIKRGHMTSAASFERILRAFSEVFVRLKPIMRKWRGILFPSIDGDAFLGTFDDHKPIYQALLKELRRGIEE